MTVILWRPKLRYRGGSCIRPLSCLQQHPWMKIASSGSNTQASMRLWLCCMDIRIGSPVFVSLRIIWTSFQPHGTYLYMFGRFPPDSAQRKLISWTSGLWNPIAEIFGHCTMYPAQEMALSFGCVGTQAACRAHHGDSAFPLLYSVDLLSLGINFCKTRANELQEPPRSYILLWRYHCNYLTACRVLGTPQRSRLKCRFSKGRRLPWPCRA